jgi:putative ABC transport system permease protein
MDSLWRTVRVGFRSLRRTPGFSVTAVLTLAIGIGLSTAVFTVAEALLIRRFPVADQDRIVLLWGETADGRFKNFPLDYTDVRRFVGASRSLQRAAYLQFEQTWPTTFRDGDRISTLRQSLVSGDFFSVLGARPALGRALTPDDDLAGAAPVAVLSWTAWQRQFGGDRGVLGKRLTLHGSRVAFSIVGVMPQGLDYPRGVDFWAPIVPSTAPTALPLMAYDVIGRLAPGATPATARTEISSFFRASGDAFVWEVRGVAHTLPSLIIGDTRPAVIVFAAAVALLLLITCVNVATLLLVRGLGRAREIAVRTALGATRPQLVKQLLIENVVLALAGGAVGVALAFAVVRVFVAVAPPDLPRLDEIHVSSTALLGAVSITALALVVFAIAPAVLTSRVALVRMLRSGVRETASRRSRLTTESLVAAQLALAVVVLSAAGLIGRTLLELQRADLALDSSRLLVASLAISDQYGSVARQTAMLEAVDARLKVTPGVTELSPVVAVPFTRGWDGRPKAEGQSEQDAATNPMLNMEVVGDRYFDALGTPVLRGRTFTAADRQGASPVVMLSESAARAYWPTGDPIGKRLVGFEKDQFLTVVGVVSDTRFRDLRDPRATIYFPLRQSTFPFVPLSLVIRTTGDPASVVPSVRRAVEEAAPGVLVSNAAPFETFLTQPLAQPRLNALLLGVFAGAAVALAAIGLFGVMMTMVRQRTRELGVRMALGATAADLRSLVMGRGLLIAASGATAGLIGALATNRLLSAMLYEVSPTDALTLTLVAGLLLCVAAVATLIPARSSTRIDPVVALRADG